MKRGLSRRTIVLLALTLFLSGAPAMAGDGAVGTWDLELDFSGQTVPSELSIWEEEGELRGTWTGQRGATDLSDVEFAVADGKLTFVRALNFQGQDFEMTFEGTIEGDELTGALTTPRGVLAVTGTRSEEEPEAARAGAEGEETEVVVSELASAEAEPFLGAWALQMSFQGNPIQMDLELEDHEGKVAAMLSSPQGDRPITDIARTEEGLELQFESGVGPLVMTAKLSGEDQIEGTLAASGGGFTTDFTGSRGVADSDSRRSFRRGRPEATLELGEEKAVRIEYADPSVEDKDFAQIEGAKEGHVVQFIEHAAIKLLTDVDLRFGEVTIEQGNAHPDYPGVYSLWLEKGDDGWRLLFNQEADVWGTMHNPEADVAEVPLEHTTRAEPTETFTVELEESENGGVLRLAWGSHQWSTPFEIGG